MDDIFFPDEFNIFKAEGKYSLIRSDLIQAP